MWGFKCGQNSSLRKQPTFGEATNHWFPLQMTSDKWTQKFHTDDTSLPCGTWTNQKHYPDLDSDASSVWNFCACFSDVIWRGNHWWRRQMSAVFSGWQNSVIEILWIKVRQKIVFDCFVSWTYTIDLPSLAKFNDFNVSAIHTTEK